MNLVKTPAIPQSLWAGLFVGLAVLSPSIALANPTDPSQADSQGAGSWRRFVEFFEREREDRSRGEPGLSRGPDVPPNDTFCIVTPGRREVIWHQQPMFVMQGQVNRMHLRPAWKDLTQPAPPTLGTDRAAPNAGGFVTTRFGNLALEPGAEYEWLFYDTPTDDLLYRLPFSIMATGKERDQIAADLAHMETALSQQGANQEAIAQAKATYFLEKDMPADALHVLFAVDNPTPDWVALQSEAIAAICSFPLGL
ncbi:hypothetical protein [Thermoleptolyngbya sp. C42_A2020_037]|uniref:hypothetical protein n=1 Tax=Thermoleptolyngbya sp. C42_A2020_037 TaxID=2747799 RepID=UPI0019FDC1C3|nr:hypothetical protein [Thermoleptolyngbya sp. C42_A2020_037]MBF2086059.1 hypothetical protein [Thermoleptolyngbya sp. C42_A2020_037]